MAALLGSCYQTPKVTRLTHCSASYIPRFNSLTRRIH